MEKGNLKAKPDARLSELPLPGKAESHRLLVEWNATAGDYPSDVCWAWGLKPSWGCSRNAPLRWS